MISGRVTYYLASVDWRKISGGAPAGPARSFSEENAMKAKILLATTALMLGVGVVASSAPAQAQDREEMMRRYHYECDRGDRRACVRFGILLGESRERHEEWRRSHPEYFWWER
jgi:hypothetical protein